MWHDAIAIAYKLIEFPFLLLKSLFSFFFVNAFATYARCSIQDSNDVCTGVLMTQ